MEAGSSPAERAIQAVLAGNPTASSCIVYIEQLFRAELQQGSPDVASLSILLGLCEVPLSVKQEANQRWPDDLQQQVAAHLEAFDGFIQQMHQKLQAAGPIDSRAKVKLVADAIWSKLTGSFSKDILHAQHVSNFTAMLLPGGAKGKRQLDCAGVVTTTYAVCQRLAQRHGQSDLEACRMQISEDHCWLTLDPSCPSAHSSIEVTTDTAVKRGLPAAEEAWAGWLYTGGQAVLCCPCRAVAALVNSVNPAVTSGKKGRDSEQLQALQYCLLNMLWREHRGAMYPAALCSLADLKEVALQDELDDVLAAGDQSRLDALLQRTGEDAQELFERAIAMATGRECQQEGRCGEGAGAAAAMAGSGKQALAGGVAADGHGAPEQQALSCEAARVPEGGEGGPPASQAADGVRVACAVQQPPTLPAEQAGCGSVEGTEAPGQQGREAPGGGPVAAERPQLQRRQQQQQASGCGTDPGWQWYPYSYLGGYLARRAEFLGKCAIAFPAAAGGYAAMALASLQGALAAFADGAAVLAKYKFTPTDDQLYKDIEGALEYCQDGLLTVVAVVAQKGATGGNSKNGALRDPALLQPVLRLWDGVCQLFAGKAKPSAWVALLLKMALLFDPAAREAAAAAEEPRSQAMRKAQEMWGPLKPVAIKPLFESADVGQGEVRAIKRPRR